MIINMANNPCGSRNAFRKTNLDAVRIELEGEAAVLGDSWKSDLIQELLDIGRNHVSVLSFNISYNIIVKILFCLQNYIEADSTDSETDYEDKTDCSSMRISPQIIPPNITTNNIKDYIPLTNKEYLKLVFSNECTAKNLLMKRASQYWWLSKSEKMINSGHNSPHFALRR